MNCVLITGGTGTFGKSYIHQSIKNKWHKKIIVFSRDEFKQVRFMRSLRSKYKNRISDYSDCSLSIDDIHVRCFIGCITNFDRLKTAMKNVDLVIHAAALKHVPVCEYNPNQAVEVNIIGAMNIAKAASQSGVKKVVGLSTDKAVDPINIYGASKLCLEKVLLGSSNYYHNSTSFHIVRYGNVLGSRGSIIETLIRSKQKEYFLTDPEMTRFWITIEEAIDLTRYAIVNGIRDETFIPKMKSLKMSSVFDYLVPDSNISIVGRRPGEKIHESMISECDMLNTYDLGEVYCILKSKKHKEIIEKNKKSKLTKMKTYTSETSEKMSKDEFISKVKNSMINDLIND